MSGSATPAYFGGRTTASSESGEVGLYMQVCLQLTDILNRFLVIGKEVTRSLANC